MQDEYQAEIEKLNNERRIAAERINELMKYKEIQTKLNICAKDGYLWTLTSAQSDFDEVTNVSLVCTRLGATATIDLSDRPVKVVHTYLDGAEVPQEMLDAAQNK